MSREGKTATVLEALCMREERRTTVKYTSMGAGQNTIIAPWKKVSVYGKIDGNVIA